MEDKKTSYTGLIVVGVIVVIIAIALMMRNKSEVVETPVADQTTVTPDTNGQPGAEAVIEDVTTGSVHSSIDVAALMTYQDAIAKYGDRRIQFLPSCQANPHTVTFKNKTELMLDNRSANARSIHMGTLGTFPIKAWGFKIIDLTSTMLPNVLAIDCDQLQNVALLTIQK